MDSLFRIAGLLPRMVPLGVITVAVVVAWSQFYGSVADVVCRASTALGSPYCAPGKVPDPAALLERLQPGGGGEDPDRCATQAWGALESSATCGDSDDRPAERTILVVGESTSFEYSKLLAAKLEAQKRNWRIVATSLDPLSAAPAAPSANLRFKGGVDATQLGNHFRPSSFTDVVFNAPRAVPKPGQSGSGWYLETGQLIDDVLVSARAVLTSEGAMRFSGGGGMPGQPRLEGHVKGNNPDYPLPAGYQRPSKRGFLSDELGVPYTPRNNNGRPLQITPAQMSWYIFPRQ